MKSIITGKHDGRQAPRLSPRQSPLNSVLDESAQVEAEHAYRAHQARGWARYLDQVAEYHDQQAAAARDVRRQAERLVWNSEPVGGAA